MSRPRRVLIPLVVLILALAGLLLTVPLAAAASAGSAFRRGIGVSHVMAWAATVPGSPREFVFPPFSDVTDAQFAAELQAIRRTGFDFVRLAVDPGPFLQFQGSRRDALDRILMRRVKLILSADLSVVVDFHPSDMNPDYTAQALTAGLTTPAFQSYLRLLERTAGQLDDLRSSKVAFELMNEPPVRPSAWQPMLEAAYRAARSRAPRLVLVLEGGDEASPAALMAMRTTLFVNDQAALVSFHYYDPYQFTHQGASWNAARYLVDVPYPARARPLDDSLTATEALIAESDLSELRKALAYQDAQARLEDYRASGFDADTIERNFGEVARWAKRQGIPADRVLLGEFGARKTALQLHGSRAAERAGWFHDVSQAAAANGFGWAVWAYRGGGFGLAATDAGDEIDPNIARALRLNSGPVPKVEIRQNMGEPAPMP
ncbi:MAG: glycoside hydrolase family 5 protein [Xanthobacteraceae bacterium]